jgi:hypothetical protein
MSRSYEYATVIQRKIEGHLKSLGFNVKQPKTQMSIEHKIQVLNYIRTLETSLDVVHHAVADTTIEKPKGE